MIDFSNMALWVAGSVIVVGCIQWAKGMVKQIIKKDAPSWIWTAVLPAASIGAGFVSGGQPVWNGLGIWAISQIGYEVIIQSVRKKIFGAPEKNVPPASGPCAPEPNQGDSEDSISEK